MAKCTLCKSRKGKRKCLITGTFICSLCCAESRNIDQCEGCSFYKDPQLNRSYGKVPSFPLKMMENHQELQDNANAIESAICHFDKNQDADINDSVVLRIVELLMDKYFFNDKVLNFGSRLEQDGFYSVDECLKEDLEDLPAEELIKIIGTIYRSVKRHTKGGREYLDFIHKYVGIRLGKGMRTLPGLPG